MSGTARHRSGSISWNLVAKILQASPGSPDDSNHWNYFRREAFAYQSGLHAALPEGLRAPRLAGVLPEPGGTGRLYLLIEDAGPDDHSAWSPERHATAARLLAQFGTTLAPDAPWLSRHFLRHASAAGEQILAALDQHQVWQIPYIKSAFPEAKVRRIHRLMEAGEGLLAELERMPRAICHFDAHRGNLFAREQGFILFDWSCVGAGAIGEEIGHQFGANLPYLAPSEAGSVVQAVVEGYIEGTTPSRRSHAERYVRKSFAISAALRGLCFNLVLALPTALDPASPRCPEIAAALGQTVEPLLALAEAA